MSRLFRKLKSVARFLGLLTRHLAYEARNHVRLFKYRIKYLNDPEVVLANLRVVAHSLDKGLCAEDREPGRGREKYLRCKNGISILESTDLASDLSLKWVREKVQDYERAENHSERTECNIEHDPPNEEDREKFVEFIMGRRSVRNFLPSKIDEGVLERIVDVARWAPNSCCRQSLFLGITENPEKIRECMSLTKGATCFSEIVPCFIAVCGDARVYPLVDKELLYIDGAIAAGNLLLAAHAYGIEGTVLNWRREMCGDENEIREILGLQCYYSVVVNIVLGYPERMPPVPERKDLDSYWRFEK